MKTAVKDLLENIPEADMKYVQALPNNEAIQLSMAISLKRIADALTSPNDYGEIGSEAIANSIVRGLQNR